MSGFLHRYRDNDPIHRYVNPGGIRDFTDSPLPGFGEGGKGDFAGEEPAPSHKFQSSTGDTYVLSNVTGGHHILYHLPSPGYNPSNRVEVHAIDRSDSDPLVSAKAIAEDHSKALGSARKEDYSMKNDDQDFYSELDGLDRRLGYATPDERRRRFLTEEVAGSEEGKANVAKLSGKGLSKAAMMAGALQSGREPSLVREGVEKRFKKS